MSKHADGHSGLNRVFYRREAGVVTRWYMARRCQEECYRAKRYKRPLQLCLVRPTLVSQRLIVQTKVSDWLREHLRTSDIPAYLGSGCYAILLPETSDAGARRLAARLQRDVQVVEVGLSSFPRDGKSFGDLLAAACGTLGRERLAA